MVIVYSELRELSSYGSFVYRMNLSIWTFKNTFQITYELLIYLWWWYRSIHLISVEDTLLVWGKHFYIRVCSKSISVIGCIESLFSNNTHEIKTDFRFVWLMTESVKNWECNEKYLGIELEFSSVKYLKKINFGQDLQPYFSELNIL